MFLGGLFTKITQTVPLRWTIWPPELKIEKHLNRLLLQNCWVDFAIITQKCSLGGPFTKIAQTVPLLWTIWPPELKIEKPLDDFSSKTAGQILQCISTEMFSWGTIYQNCSKGSAPLNKMAARAKNRKTFKRLRLPNCWAEFEINFTEMFLRRPFTKIAQMVPLRWTIWPPELKIEKTFKRLLLQNCWADFEIISQKCFLGDPLPKLLKRVSSAEQNGRQS